MSIYIQQADQLKKLTGEKLTSSKIIAALGFTPSTFDGDYESLTNKPITNSDDDNTTLYVQDSSGNIIAMINENGLTTVDVNVDGTSVKTFISSAETEIGNLSTKAEKSYVDERFNSLTFADIKGDPNLTDSDDSFSIADKNGNVIAYIDVNGLVTPAIKTSAIETTTIKINGVDYTTTIDDLEEEIGAVQGQANTNANNIRTNADNIKANADDIDALQEIVTSDGLTYTATEFIIQDNLGNTALKLDDEALTVRYIKSDTTDEIKSQVESNAGAILGITNDLSDHTKDTDIHITPAERESWDAKADTNYVDQAIADLVDSAPDTLDTLNELAVAIKGNASVIEALDAAITTKADKTTVEGVQKEVDAAESEIDALQQIVTEDGLNYTATEFIIKNDIGDIALQLDGEALTVRNIKSDTTDNIIERIEALSGRVDPIEQATHTHDNKAILDDIDVAFTSTLKQQYDKAEENVIEEITVDKGTVTMDGTTAKITGVAAQSDLETLQGVVQNKANSSDLEALGGRVETAEGEIDALQGLIDEEGLTFNNDEFVIEDSEHNVLAKFDSSGLTVTAVNTETLNATEIVSPTIDNIKGQIAPLETAKHTHENKDILDNTTASYTTAEKSKLEGIQAGAEVNTIESITTDNSKVTVGMSGTTAQIKGVAAQSDLDSLSGDVENKVDKETGKGLSTNDYTTTEKSKLEGIAASATKVEDSATNGNIKINDVETNVYTLPKATSSVLGGVKQGSNITIDGDGVISTHDPYELPVATVSQLGGVKQGDNVTIAADGTISVEKYTLPENVLTEDDVVNNLESSSTTQPLSAAQGKALQERINGLALGEENVIEKIQVNSVDQTITDKTVNISVPTTTNDLTNNSGFITKDVNDLTSYYKKDETYTKGEVDNIVSDKAIYDDSTYNQSGTDLDKLYVATAAAGCVGPTNIKIGDFAKSTDLIGLLSEADIVDNLTTDEPLKPLSAAQGKALKSAIDSITGDLGQMGGGDMMRATYDTDLDGQVEYADYADVSGNANQLGGQLPTAYMTKSAYDSDNDGRIESADKIYTGEHTGRLFNGETYTSEASIEIDVVENFDSVQLTRSYNYTPVFNQTSSLGNHVGKLELLTELSGMKVSDYTSGGAKSVNNALNADKLGGYEPNYYATADALNTAQSTLEQEISNKQNILESGTTIKTINGESILGEGNITIEAGSGSLTEVPVATTDAIGGFKAAVSNTYGDSQFETMTSTSGRFYHVGIDAATNKAYVNIPWTDTTYDLSDYLKLNNSGQIENADVLGWISINNSYYYTKIEMDNLDGLTFYISGATGIGSAEYYLHPYAFVSSSNANLGSASYPWSTAYINQLQTNETQFAIKDSSGNAVFGVDQNGLYATKLTLLSDKDCFTYNFILTDEGFVQLDSNAHAIRTISTDISANGGDDWVALYNYFTDVVFNDQNHSCIGYFANALDIITFPLARFLEYFMQAGINTGAPNGFKVELIRGIDFSNLVFTLYTTEGINHILQITEANGEIYSNGWYCDSIKTINGQSLYGVGNITIEGTSTESGTSSIVVDNALSTTSTNPVQNAVVTNAINSKVSASALNNYLKLTGGTITDDLTVNGYIFNDYISSLQGDSLEIYGDDGITINDRAGNILSFESTGDVQLVGVEGVTIESISGDPGISIQTPSNHISLESDGMFFTRPINNTTVSITDNLEVNQEPVITSPDSSCLKIVRMTQTAYDALSEVDENTFYIIAPKTITTTGSESRWYNSSTYSSNIPSSTTYIIAFSDKFTLGDNQQITGIDDRAYVEYEIKYYDEYGETFTINNGDTSKYSATLKWQDAAYSVGGAQNQLVSDGIPKGSSFYLMLDFSTGTNSPHFENVVSVSLSAPLWVKTTTTTIEE